MQHSHGKHGGKRSIAERKIPKVCLDQAYTRGKPADLLDEAISRGLEHSERLIQKNDGTGRGRIHGSSEHQRPAAGIEKWTIRRKQSSSRERCVR